MGRQLGYRDCDIDLGWLPQEEVSFKNVFSQNVVCEALSGVLGKHVDCCIGGLT